MKYSAPWYKESSLGPSPFHTNEATSHNRAGLKDLMQHTELVWTLFLQWIRKCEMFKTTAHYHLVPPLWCEHSFSVTIVLLLCLQMKTFGYQEKFCLVHKLVCQWSDRMLQLPQWMLYGALILFAWSQNLDSYNIVCKLQSRLWYRAFLENVDSAPMNSTLCRNINLPISIEIGTPLNILPSKCIFAARYSRSNHIFTA